MDHILARIRGANLEDIRSALKADAPIHAEHGLTFRHLWRNADDPNEILYIFTTADLNHSRQFLQSIQAQARTEDPNAILPDIVFLKGE